MQPLYDNLTVIRHQCGEDTQAAKRIQEMRESEKLMITPLAYIRGRSLQRMFFIVDEAQNLTPHEVKTIITRAGEGTKIVFTGDIAQIDQPYLDALSNGLSLPDPPDDRPADLRPRHAREGRAIGPGRPRQRAALKKGDGSLLLTGARRLI